MKNKHILHIGFPRCGSSWLWENLIQHPNFDLPEYEKENTIMFNDTLPEYENFYKNYNISANFNPNLWMIDLALVQYISKYTTHVSITLRNPYDFIERYYDFISRGQDCNTFIDLMIDLNHLDYQTICCRWHSALDNNVKFKIFYFDDLTADPTLFLSNYFNFCGLDAILIEDCARPVNQSIHSTKTIIDFLPTHKKIINQYIDNFSNYTNTNLSHWKR